ncbi:MAG: SDR family NAD(P)-dependent oxidoreductase [Betaproteobacteria bacterium]|nr:SDR family NAD(P)-dependent oxidoreductase [Betaproteobacteria bacterium]
MPDKQGQLIISEQQSQEFAALSGDYNPLHVDKIYARRLQFGQPVIHGIHHLLRIWDACFVHQPFSQNTQLTALFATFSNPVSVNQTIDYSCQIDPEQLSAVLTAYNDKQQKILSLTLHFSKCSEPIVNGHVLTTQPPVETPIDQTFPPKHSNGTCPLYLDSTIAQKSFPNLFEYLPPHQLAQLLACTRVVGMKCPGLNSIFSRIKLDFNSNFSVTDQASLYYAEMHKDARVGILKLSVEAQGMNGFLDTFFRPPPVIQPSYPEVCTKVTNNIFSSQRALVIGGSRGVGEITAKILAAGGADVILTYNKGQAEAEEVCREITHNNGHCQIMKVDVMALDKQSLAQFKDGLLPSHIYYFASPHISSNRTKVWDSKLFTKFCGFYLDAFSGIVKCYADGAKKLNTSITFFYPSTIFIEQPEKGFSEYAVAKGAGETLCAQFAAEYQKFRFITPRLTRMQTDQTSSIIPIKCDAVFDVMHRELKTIESVD